MNDGPKSFDNLYKEKNEINHTSIIINRLSKQQSNQSVTSPFQVISKVNEPQSPFAIEQTSNCKLSESQSSTASSSPSMATPISPFSIEKNSTKYGYERASKLKSGLKISTVNNETDSTDKNQSFPLSPFQVSPRGTPNIPRTTIITKNQISPFSSKSCSNQLFSTPVDMPIIPQADNYSRNRSSCVNVNPSLNSISTNFSDVKKELKMVNINSMVSNVRKEQESNTIDKILFNTQYSGVVDQNIPDELVRHNTNNKTLLKCFSRSSSGIFSFKPADAPNINSTYCIEMGTEPGTSTIRQIKDLPINNMVNSIVPENLAASSFVSPGSSNSQNTNQNSSTNNAENKFASPQSPKTQPPQMSSQNITVYPINPNGMSHIPSLNETSPSPQNNYKLVSTFNYDQEYLLWREAMLDVLREGIEIEDTGDRNITSPICNINNSKQIDYSLRMPIELLALLNINNECLN